MFLADVHWLDMNTNLHGSLFFELIIGVAVGIIIIRNSSKNPFEEIDLSQSFPSSSQDFSKVMAFIIWTQCMLQNCRSTSAISKNEYFLSRPVLAISEWNKVFHDC